MSVLDSGGSQGSGTPPESRGSSEDKPLREFPGRARRDGKREDRLFTVLARALPSFYPFASCSLPRILRPMYGPDDIIQESYLGLLKNRGTVVFPEESNLRPWFRGVIGMKVVSLCRRQLAKKRTAPFLNSGGFHATTIEEMEEIPCKLPSPEEEILWEEKVQWVLNQMECLSPRAYLLVIHHCHDGAPLREAASWLGLGAAEASRLLDTAKKQIRKRCRRSERQEEGASMVL